jgi:hypothetical protein
MSGYQLDCLFPVLNVVLFTTKSAIRHLGVVDLFLKLRVAGTEFLALAACCVRVNRSGFWQIYFKHHSPLLRFYLAVVKQTMAFKAPSLKVRQRIIPALAPKNHMMRRAFGVAPAMLACVRVTFQNLQRQFAVCSV